MILHAAATKLMRGMTLRQIAHAVREPLLITFLHRQFVSRDALHDAGRRGEL